MKELGPAQACANQWLDNYSYNSSTNTLTINTSDLDVRALTDAEAHATGGDIRAVVLALLERLHAVQEARRDVSAGEDVLQSFYLSRQKSVTRNGFGEDQLATIITVAVMADLNTDNLPIE